MDNAVDLDPDPTRFRDGFQQDIVHAVIVGPIGQWPDAGRRRPFQPDTGTPAQQAVVNGLLKAIGSQPYPTGPAIAILRQQAAAQARSRPPRPGSRPCPPRRGTPGCRQLRRPEGRPHHPGADAMTPATPAATQPLPLPPPRPCRSRPVGVAAASAARLVWLHVRSRRAPAALVALAACGLVLWIALDTTGGSDPARRPTRCPTLLEGCAAAIIAVTTHSALGEPERATGRWLPFLRLGLAIALCGAAIGLLAIGAAVAFDPKAGIYLADGILPVARNLMGFTGVGLILSLFIGGLLSWIGPLTYRRALPVRRHRELLRATDLGIPPGDRPRRLDRRDSRLRGRPGRVHDPRPPHPPVRRVSPGQASLS